MTNIVILVRDRPRLTMQCLNTLYANTPIDAFRLLIVDDGSERMTADIVRSFGKRQNCQTLRLAKPVSELGWLKQVGAWASERTFGRGDWLYFGDNDTAFLPKWHERLTGDATRSESDCFVLWGGQVHPYHHPATENGFLVHHMLDGPSWLMRWGTWDNFKDSLVSDGKGECKSEDVKFCWAVIAAGLRIGVTVPHCVLHTGLTNTSGKPAPGWEIRAQNKVQGIIYE